MVVFTKDVIKTVWVDTLKDVANKMSSVIDEIVSEDVKKDARRLTKCCSEIKMAGAMMVPLFMDMLSDDVEYFSEAEVMQLSTAWGMSSIIGDTMPMAEFLENMDPELVKCVQLTCERVPTMLVIYWLNSFEEHLKVKTQEAEHE